MSLLPLELDCLTPEESAQVYEAKWERLGQGTYHKVYISSNSMTLGHYTCHWVIKYPFSNTAWILLSKDPITDPKCINQIFEKLKHDAIIVCYDTHRYFFYKDPLHPMADETISVKYEVLAFTKETEKA